MRKRDDDITLSRILIKGLEFARKMFTFHYI